MILAGVGFLLSFAYEASIRTKFVRIQFRKESQGIVLDDGPVVVGLPLSDIKFDLRKTADGTRFAPLSEKEKLVPESFFTKLFILTRLGCLLAIVFGWIGTRLLRPLVVDTSPRSDP
jgi:hypothetical protein